MSEPTFSLPPYTYIPGQTPHPISDPQGHSYDRNESEQIDPDRQFQYGLFLFRNEYYWEAHEAWEQVWIHLGKKGAEADCIKGLIKLAAAGVKCLEGNEAGANRHFNRAIELLPTDNGVILSFCTALLMAEDLIDSIRKRLEQLEINTTDKHNP